MKDAVMRAHKAPLLIEHLDDVNGAFEATRTGSVARQVIVFD